MDMMKLENLHTKFLGINNIYYDVIDSTQTEIWRMYNSNKQNYNILNTDVFNCNTSKCGIPNGTLIWADVQEQGKGTHGRVWHTDIAGNIAFSFFLNYYGCIKVSM